MTRAFQFKPGFQLGVATAAAQIEGGKVDSNWFHFSEIPGAILDGSHVQRANRHWELYEEDIALLEELGIKHYRMSLDWARIEPEEGVFDEAAFERYRTEIQKMCDLGLHVFLTFHHFSHPQWFEKKGAFLHYENLDAFLRYVEKSLDYIADLVSDYCTVNEPNVYAVNTYFFGEWMRYKKSLRNTLQMMNVFIALHIRTYELIHQFRKKRGYTNTRVSFAHHVRHFTPATACPHDRLGARLLSYLFQDGLFCAAAMGEFAFPFKNLAKAEKGRYIDFIALNYYSRGATRFFQDTTLSDVPKNDLGWEIYPKGLIEEARRCYAHLPLPIVISENGCCDNEDLFRPRYIYDHLLLMTDSELPFEAYYHWCFLDNFEWAVGELARFGLVHCDYETQKRTLKKSAKFYAQMIRDHGVTASSYETYVKPCRYHQDEVNIVRDYVVD